MKQIVHKSTDNGAMSQLDSVLTQIREKARGNEWELIVLKPGDGSTSLSLTVQGLANSEPTKPPSPEDDTELVAESSG